MSWRRASFHQLSQSRWSGRLSKPMAGFESQRVNALSERPSFPTTLHTTLSVVITVTITRATRGGASLPPVLVVATARAHLKQVAASSHASRNVATKLLVLQLLSKPMITVSHMKAHVKIRTMVSTGAFSTTPRHSRTALSAPTIATVTRASRDGASRPPVPVVATARVHRRQVSASLHANKN